MHVPGVLLMGFVSFVSVVSFVSLVSIVSLCERVHKKGRCLSYPKWSLVGLELSLVYFIVTLNVIQKDWRNTL